MSNRKPITAEDARAIASKLIAKRQRADEKEVELQILDAACEGALDIKFKGTLSNVFVRSLKARGFMVLYGVNLNRGERVEYDIRW